MSGNANLRAANINKNDEFYTGYEDIEKELIHYTKHFSDDRTLIWKRVFSEKQQNQAYKEQNGKCAICGKKFEIKELEAHHKKAFADGGETVIDNCQLLCKDCHSELTAKMNQKIKKKK